ncbi:sigma-54-dependent transcriptional regulator [Actomonas aquatica]|uniref:Sigma-54 dependent transcriptional regulator n=1 Tax=Actomonas aquatica TaxID=2866162 RepID=A0ABZ1C5M9_9BACT|nr:sigma-54 dependent transcriptional regulator [Opitutus sp. WL0086]WRQ87043.1 sigma-54 dependent transcriptional regulator [Opitutus sp. WL0086]
MRLNGCTLLLVEDEPLLRRRFTAQLEKQGAEVSAAASLAEARNLLADLAFDFALFDVNLPDGRSLELLSEGAVSSDTVVVVMTAEGGVEGAVEAMRLGAADYLVKPFEAVEAAVRLARARGARRKQRGEAYREERAAAQDEALVFGPSLQPVRSLLEKIVGADRRVAAGAGAPAPVLIEGETGTGKTSFARWLHRNGPRAKGPLIEVNCSALPDALAESELFGHERGAFTDAKEAKIGLMEAADGGTLFLDELTSLSAAVQAKLLTAIEDRMVRRLGGQRLIPVDVRIVAAAQGDLAARVEAGEFREDLRQRLDLFRVRIPPLRERGEDVVALAETLAGRIAARYGLTAGPIPAVGRARLLAHTWPGNVRELAHEIERSVVFDDDRLTFAGLAGADEAEPAGAWLRRGFRFPEDGGFELEVAIDQMVDRAIAQAGGNVSAAARLLGVPRDYVRYRLKRREEGGE